MQPRRTRFYRDKVNAKWLGVCAGVADYFHADVFWVRVATAISVPITGGWTLLLYVVMAIVADRKPHALYSDSPEDQRFWSDVRVAPTKSIRNVHSRFRDIDRRLRDIEAHAVASNSRLAAEIDGLR